jgi:hypothetical protein
MNPARQHAMNTELLVSDANYFRGISSGENYECDLDQAASSNGSCIIQGGDSGGPVFTAGSTTDPFATGTVTAELKNTAGNLVCTQDWWSDMYEEKVIFGTSPAT